MRRSALLCSAVLALSCWIAKPSDAIITTYVCFFLTGSTEINSTERCAGMVAAFAETWDGYRRGERRANMAELQQGSPPRVPTEPVMLPFWVVGYATDLASDEENRVLSLQRALVVAAMLERAGIPREHIRVVGEGSRNPLVTLDRPEGGPQNPQNQRVTIEFDGYTRRVR
ncbi:OmpA family protein [Sabulicella rubraurantiaca]|uniref:OmpA family protein n=1 Tax=Sabulicella rubraurantiaca TaxID=2811429 RepID=UPI001A9735CA|nr:OmpA family protein [Sabulicella rubraurantiaca]